MSEIKADPQGFRGRAWMVEVLEEPGVYRNGIRGEITGEYTHVIKVHRLGYQPINIYHASEEECLKAWPAERQYWLKPAKG